MKKKLDFYNFSRFWMGGTRLKLSILFKFYFPVKSLLLTNHDPDLNLTLDLKT